MASNVHLAVCFAGGKAVGAWLGAPFPFELIAPAFALEKLERRWWWWWWWLMMVVVVVAVVAEVVLAEVVLAVVVTTLNAVLAHLPQLEGARVQLERNVVDGVREVHHALLRLETVPQRPLRPEDGVLLVGAGSGVVEVVVGRGAGERGR